MIAIKTGLTAEIELPYFLCKDDPEYNRYVRCILAGIDDDNKPFKLTLFAEEITKIWHLVETNLVNKD